jgi:large subunit ribosomal protein L32
MPQEPKKRHSRARQGKRRHAIKLSIPKLTTCKNCANKIAFHTVCPACGYYKNVKVIQIKAAKKE